MQTNSFEGALPGRGFQVMRAMSALIVHGNRFAGTLPNLALERLRVLTVNNNNLEGKTLQTQSELFGLCNTLNTESRGGLPRPQLAGRANPTALVWRQRAAGPKMRGSQTLRASCQLGQHALYVVQYNCVSAEGGVVDSKIAPMLGLVSEHSSWDGIGCLSFYVGGVSLAHAHGGKDDVRFLSPLRPKHCSTKGQFPHLP
eukprot:2796447-Amphidinium_carterae.1